MISIIINAWSDFFSEVSAPSSTKKTTNREDLSSSTKVHVIDSFISFTQSTTQGGAIRCYTSDDNTYFLVEKTTILNCRSNGDGGGIYYGYYGHNILSKVCFFNCSTINSYKGQFAYLEVKGSSSNKNEIHDVSLSYCSQESGMRSIFLWYGKIICESTNSSYNTCKEYPGIRNTPSTSSLVSFSSFTSNSAVTSGIIALGYNVDGAQHTLISCNILNNTQNIDSTQFGLIDSGCPTTIENSCIIKNSGKYIFRQYNSYTAIFNNCTIDGTLTTSGTAPAINNKPKTTFINVIELLNTAQCKGVPINMKKKRSFCVTCRKNSYGPSISVYRLVKYAFLLNFVPSNPSSDPWYETILFRNDLSF